MAKFSKIVDSPSGSKFILQGNAAFALGVVHAGYHSADGYPGTPSTEVIDKSLAQVQDRINVGWSVNEAVATGVAVGHAVAGYDVVVTMKIPGVFQAGDVISTSAFYQAKAGALVFYVASDYVPSSTQHVLDPRYFFASAKLPILEPRNHQEMYEIAGIAADISRQFNTPVVVLASGILAHSEGLVTTKEPRKILPRELPRKLHAWMLTPFIARNNYNSAVTQRIPQLQEWSETSPLATISRGKDDFGIIVNGEAKIIVKEALETLGLNPSVLSLAIANPLPIKKIMAFAESIKGQPLIIEDGGQFIEEKIRLMGISVLGKGENSTITNWTPETVYEFLNQHLKLNIKKTSPKLNLQPLRRPPTICPGCPYRAIGLTIAKLKKKKKIFASFGDIGCSTLLYFLNALDTVLCMGASESMRQGFVLSKPEMADQVISIVGDSCECHSGLDATRNAVFRNIPGVKIILDNRTTAMTGGQPAPTSEKNLAGKNNRFVLKDALEAEKTRVIVADAYHTKEIEKILIDALESAKKGEFTTIIIEGLCIKVPHSRIKNGQMVINNDKCKKCGLCQICPGIQQDDEGQPYFTLLCSQCMGNQQICMQQCPFDAIEFTEPERKRDHQTVSPEKFNYNQEKKRDFSYDLLQLPPSLRLVIRGIGGQGNLFFGKVLAQVILRTPYAETNIIKGDTHGMAQLGGPVISTFSCGNTFSPTFAPHSADVLVVMEASEILRPDFLDLLKPGGIILFNSFQALPVTAKKDEYPDIEEILSSLKEYLIIPFNAYQVALDLGDRTGKTANVVVLGLLSSINPFCLIPEDIWIEGLMSVSPTVEMKKANLLAFKTGRYLSEK